MHWRYLNSGAAWGNQPVEAFGLGQLANRMDWVTFADARDKLQMGFYAYQVTLRGQCFDAHLIKFNGCFQKALGAAEKNNSDINEFFSFRVGHKPDNSIIK